MDGENYRLARGHCAPRRETQDATNLPNLLASIGSAMEDGDATHQGAMRSKSIRNQWPAYQHAMEDPEEFQRFITIVMSFKNSMLLPENEVSADDHHRLAIFSFAPQSQISTILRP